MRKNVGTGDRVARAMGGVVLLTCSLMAPLPLLVRVASFGSMGMYLLFTALAGSCVGYRLMGKSTCGQGAPP